MSSVDAAIRKILSDPSALSLSIEADQNFKSIAQKDQQPSDEVLEDVLRTDSHLTAELARYNQLKVVSDLIKEFNANYELIELENCYYSLQNLHKKLKAVDISGESFTFQQSVGTYIDCLHLNLLEKILSVLKKFWKVSDQQIEFNKIISIEENNFDYNTLIEMCQSYFFSEKVIDQSHWFIAETNLETYKEKEIKLLQEILDDFIKLRPIISVLKRFAFDEKLKLIQVENVLHCSADSKDAFDKIESYKVLIDFLYNNLTHSITENGLRR